MVRKYNDLMYNLSYLFNQLEISSVNDIGVIKTTQRRNRVRKQTPIVPLNNLRLSPITVKLVQHKVEQISTKYGFSLSYPVFAHQYTAIDWALEKEAKSVHGVSGGILSLEMGLGKTLVVLILTMISRSKGPTLVVCTKSLLESMSDDVTKFFGKQLSFKVLFGDMTPAMIKGYDLVITTYDTVLSLSKKNNEEFFSVPWYRVVADESQKISNPEAKISKAMLRFKPGRRICLTGTPVRNYEYDLLSQFLFCGIDMKGERWTYEVYKRLNIRDNILVMTMKDANIKLPPKIINNVWLDFSENERVIYEKIHLQAKNIFDRFRDKSSATFANVLTQFMRMRQASVCCYMIRTAILNGESNEWLQKIERSGYESSKFSCILNIINHKKHAHEKIIIFSAFTQALEILGRFLNSQNYSTILVDGSTSNRHKLFNQFKKSTSHNVLLLSSNVGSVGLNLQQANHVVLMEPWWNSVNGLQAEARCHRIGQTQSVHVWRLYMKKSIEEVMLEMCKSKDTMASKFLTPELVSILLR